MKKVDEQIDMAQANGKYKNICGLGDYNFPDIEWVPGMLPANSSSITHENHQKNCLLDFLRSNLMFQVAKIPTRLKNILDLVIVNNDAVVKECNTEVNVTL